MKELRRWDDAEERLAYMIHRRLRTWVWAARKNADENLRLDEKFRGFSDELKMIRSIPSEESALQRLTALNQKIDEHLFGALSKYVGRLSQKVSSKNMKSTSLDQVGAHLDNKEYDPIILLYMTDAIDIMALSEEKPLDDAITLNAVKTSMEVIIELYNDKKFDLAVALLNERCELIKKTKYAGNDVAVTLAAAMRGLEIPSNMASELMEYSKDNNLIGTQNKNYLNLLDLGDAVKYAKVLGELKFELEADVKGGLAKLLGENAKLTGTVLKDFLKQYDQPRAQIDKLKEMFEAVISSSAGDAKNPVQYKKPIIGRYSSAQIQQAKLLQNELVRLIRENKNDPEVKDFVVNLNIKGNMLDWDPARFKFNPRSTARKAVMEIYANDSNIVLHQMFAVSAGQDPFRPNGVIDAARKRLFSPFAQVNSIPIGEIAQYMMDNPQNAKYFIQERSTLLGGRNFRKEFTDNANVIGKMMTEGGAGLRNLLLESGIASKSDYAVHSEFLDKSMISNLKSANQPKEPRLAVSIALSGAMTPQEKAQNLIKEIEAMLEMESVLDDKRKKEIRLQVSMVDKSITSLINRPHMPQSRAKFISMLESIKRVLMEEMKLEESDHLRDPLKSVEDVSSAGDADPVMKGITSLETTGGDYVMSALRALDSIETIESKLDSGSALDPGKIREIKAQLKIFSGLIKNRQWDDNNSKLLQSIEDTVSVDKSDNAPKKL